MIDINDVKSKRLSLKEIRESNCMSDEDLEELEIKLIEIKLQAEVDEWYRKKGKKQPRRNFFPNS